MKFHILASIAIIGLISTQVIPEPKHSSTGKTIIKSTKAYGAIVHEKQNPHEPRQVQYNEIMDFCVPSPSEHQNNAKEGNEPAKKDMS